MRLSSSTEPSFSTITPSSPIRFSISFPPTKNKRALTEKEHVLKGGPRRQKAPSVKRFNIISSAPPKRTPQSILILSRRLHFVNGFFVFRREMSEKPVDLFELVALKTGEYRFFGLFEVRISGRPLLYTFYICRKSVGPLDEP